MVYIHLAEGFEEIEALTCADLLRRAGIPAETVAVTDSAAPSLTVKGAHDIQVTADISIEDACYDSCEMIVLPGGLPGTLNLEKNPVLSDVIDSFNAEGRYIAAICAAPMILGHKGILDGREAVIYPGMEAELGNADIRHDAAVVSGHIITGRGPGCAAEFALRIIEVLRGAEKSEEVRKGLAYPCFTD